MRGAVNRARHVGIDKSRLVIDPARLTAPLKWEPSGDDLATLFPHIYGPIDRAAVQEVRAVRRAADGEFLGW
jgi:uncharacterized protein (DUF952 family)